MTWYIITEENKKKIETLKAKGFKINNIIEEAIDNLEKNNPDVLDCSGAYIRQAFELSKEAKIKINKYCKNKGVYKYVAINQAINDYNV